MTKSEDEKTTIEFYETCVDVIKEMKKNAREILDREKVVENPLRPDSKYQRVMKKLRFWVPMEEHVFDSSQNPMYALLTRAASHTVGTPIIRLSELVNSEKARSNLDIELMGEKPGSGKRVRILDLVLSDKTDNPRETVVIDWIFPIPAKYTFFSFMASSHGLLVSEVLVPSLEAINRHLSTNRTY